MHNVHTNLRTRPGAWQKVGISLHRCRKYYREMGVIDSAGKLRLREQAGFYAVYIQQAACSLFS